MKIVMSSSRATARATCTWPSGTPGAQLLTVAEISAKLTLYGNIRRPDGRPPTGCAAQEDGVRGEALR
ncbi:MAG: hypothetical protein IJT19_04840 [Bacteroidaceae bacterium]|nr:hypothetical protein [Bacteroidaceae bacterium]